MDRFKNILVAVAPGKLDAVSLRRTGELAAANGAKVTILDVIEPLPAWRRVVNLEGRDIDVQQLLVRDREERLEHLAELTGLTDVAVAVKTGKPFVEVIRHVIAQGCDLVVVGEPKPMRSSPSGISAGVMHLLRKCPVPVWAIRPSPAPQPRILALVDPDPADPARHHINDLVLELAKSLAQRQGGELHVGHAWRLMGEETLRSSEFLSVTDSEVDMMLTIEGEEHRSQVEKLMERHAIVEAGGRLHLVEGDPGSALPDLAMRLGADLIVMGTLARSGLSGLIIGNTAETVLRSVDCSVLALKPAGFVSPVHLDDHGAAR